MFIEDLDRHQWNLEQAKQHTEELIRTRRERDGATPETIRRPEWAKPDYPVKQSLDEARNELFTTLRDRDLHATGRTRNSAASAMPPARPTGISIRAITRRSFRTIGARAGLDFRRISNFATENSSTSVCRASL